MFKFLTTVSLLFITFAIYFFLPTLAFGFWGVPIIILIIGSGIFFITDFETKIPLNIGLLVAVLLPFVLSFPGFYSDSYRDLLGTPSTKEFSKEVSPIDITKVRIVDEELAAKLGEKLLGSNPALGSVVILGEFNIQSVNKELYWVAPLLHTSIFKWFGSEGTPGFVMVSATNSSDVKLVQDINGKAISLKYQPNAFFSENLERYMYFNGYATTGLTDYSFELDENLNPFYVVTIFEKTIGYSGNEAIGVAILNPQTGEIKKYSMNDIPTWVDRVQPENFVVSQINDWGEYVHGWLNSMFAQKEALTSSKGISLIYGSDNNSYWYSGITSVGKEGSTVGFMLINTRTKEAKWYKQAGATEAKAATTAEGEVQEKGYTSTWPILYNVLGLPTYVTTLKDKEGLVKLIAFISVENYSIVGTGKTIKSALRSYKSLLSASGNKTTLSSDFETIKSVGYIERISNDIKNGNSFYYFKLANDNSNRIYMTNAILSDDIVLTQIGDKVSVEYEKSDTKYIDLVNFKNNTF